MDLLNLGGFVKSDLALGFVNKSNMDLDLGFVNSILTCSKND